MRTNDTANSLRYHHVVLLTILVSALSTTACRPSLLEQEVQKLWPAESPSDKQAAAVQAAYENLDRLQAPNLYLDVSRADFERFGPGAIKTLVKEADGNRQGQPTLDKVVVTLGQQEAVTTASFDHFFKELNGSIEGDAVLHTAFAIENRNIVTRPSFSTVKIKKIRVAETRDLGAVVPVINTALTRFLDNLNGQLANVVIPINVGLIRAFKTKELMESAPNLSSVDGPDIVVNSALASSGLLIDDSGIHLLGQILNLSPKDFGRILGDLTKSPALPPNPTAEQVAFLSQCGMLFPIEKPETPTFLQFRSLCAAYLAPKVPVKPASGPEPVVASGDMRSFTMLVKLFRSKANEVESEANLPWKDTAIVVSKSLVSDAIAKFAGDPHLTATFTVPPRQQHFNQEIRTDKAPNLECERNSGACDINYSCDQTTDCSAVMGCPSDCAWYDVGCHAWKPACEAIKATKKGACEAAKSSARAACEAKKGIDKASCEAAKSARRAGCEANQGWLNTFQEINIGRLEGDVALGNGHVTVGLDAISVAPDLRSMAVRGSVSAEGDIAADTKFTPWEAGHILCSAQWTGHLAAKAVVQKNDLNLSGALSPVVTSDKSLDLILQTSPQNFTLKIVPPPLTALLSQNPQLFFICQGAIAGLSLSAHLRDQAMQDSIDFTLPAQEIHVKIAPQEVIVGDGRVTVYPNWKDKSIQAIASVK